jgi:hypothetical protein
MSIFRNLCYLEIKVLSTDINFYFYLKSGIFPRGIVKNVEVGDWGLGTGDWGLVTGDWGLVTGDWGLGTGDW